MKMVLGTELSSAEQSKALNMFVHRYTGDTKPNWTNRADCAACPVQFKNDAEWLANTLFYVTKDGVISRKYNYCVSNPTWPNNPELRKAV